MDYLVEQLSLAHGRSVCHMGSGWIGWRLRWFVGRSVIWCVDCFFVDWLVACVGQGVSESFGRSVDWRVWCMCGCELDCLVGWMVGC